MRNIGFRLIALFSLFCWSFSPGIAMASSWHSGATTNFTEGNNIGIMDANATNVHILDRPAAGITGVIGDNLVISQDASNYASILHVDNSNVTFKVGDDLNCNIKTNNYAFFSAIDAGIGVSNNNVDNSHIVVGDNAIVSIAAGNPRNLIIMREFTGATITNSSITYGNNASLTNNLGVANMDTSDTTRSNKLIFGTDLYIDAGGDAITASGGQIFVGSNATIQAGGSAITAKNESDISIGANATINAVGDIGTVSAAGSSILFGANQTLNSTSNSVASVAGVGGTITFAGSTDITAAWDVATSSNGGTITFEDLAIIRSEQSTATATSGGIISFTTAEITAGSAAVSANGANSNISFSDTARINASGDVATSGNGGTITFEDLAIIRSEQSIAAATSGGIISFTAAEITAGSAAVSANGANSNISFSDTAIINASGDVATSSNGGTITFEDLAIIRSEQSIATATSGGIISFTAAEITAGSAAVSANGANSNISFSDTVRINASGDVATSSNGGTITFEDLAMIITDGNAVLADNATVTFTNVTSLSASGDIAIATNNGTLAFGDNTTIVADGQSICANDNSNISFGTGAKTTAIGNEKQGVTSANSSNISFGTGAEIIVTGQKTKGIVAEDKSVVTMAESATITVNGDSDSAALCAIDGGEIYIASGATIEAANVDYIIIADSSTTDQSIVQLVDVAELTGNVKTGDKSKVDISIATNGTFAGAFETSLTGISNLALNAGSTWNVTETSNLNTLTAVSGGTVNFQFSPSYSAISTGVLSGNSATFIMKTNIEEQTGDKLIVSNNSEGSHIIVISNDGSANVTGNERLTLVETGDQGSSFTLATTVELGAFEYNLRNNSDGNGRFDSTGGQYWELYCITNNALDPPSASRAGSAAISTFLGGYLLNYTDTTTLIKRLGDLRTDTYSNGAWFRVFGGQFDSDARNYAEAFDMRYWGIQAGYDYKLDNPWIYGGDTYVGAFMTSSNGSTSVRDGRGTVENLSMGMYATYVGDNGFYVDTSMKYVRQEKDFSIRDSADAVIIGNSVVTGGVGISIEAGKRLRFDSHSASPCGGWYVEPQAQLSWQHMSGGKYHASNGLVVGIDAYNSLLGRVGALFGFENTQTNIYGKAFYMKELGAKLDIYANGSYIAEEDLKNGWFIFGLGLTHQFSPFSSIYLDFERASNRQFTQNWAINAGLRITF